LDGNLIMGNIRLYGSTSGYTELAPPAVAPDGVLSLPSGTGTIATQAFVADDYLPIAGGKVLQVVRATDTTNRSTTSTSFVDVTGMSVTITPQKSNSMILVIASINSGSSTGRATFALTDSSNNLLSGAERMDERLETGNMTIIGYNTPATTSAVTYKMRFLKSTSGTATVYNDINTGQMFAIEVSA
jgi:hypothetical protein